MSDTIKVNLSFIDSGDSIDDKTVTEGLTFSWARASGKLKFADNNEKFYRR